MTSSGGVPDRDYVLGTHDEELARLGLQHWVWRARVLDVWGRAGISTGQTVLDIGCGPGYAAFDLAEVVGPAGRVVAVERSRRFLEALEAERANRGLSQIETHEMDLDDGLPPAIAVDAAWCRWVLAFVRDPRVLLDRVARAVRPGGLFIVHEYFNYAAWQMAPRLRELDEFVRLVIDGWRAAGGEPDIALELPQWLPEAGFRVVDIRPMVDAITPRDDRWRWPASFLEIGLRRFESVGAISSTRAVEIARAFAERERDLQATMITPGVMEIIAVRE